MQQAHLFVQVLQHLLLELVLAVVDADGVVVCVEAVDAGLDAGLVEEADVGCGLAGLLAHEDHLRVDQAERVDHHL